MTILAIIGFIAVVILALYMSAATIGVFIGEMGFTGKTSAFTYVFATITCGLWYCVYALFPSNIIKITIGA